MIKKLKFLILSRFDLACFENLNVFHNHRKLIVDNLGGTQGRQLHFSDFTRG